MRPTANHPETAEPVVKPEVAAMIEGYRPRFMSPTEAAIGTWRPRFPRPQDTSDVEVVLPTVREWVTATVPKTVKVARVLMYKTTYYAVWGLGTTGTLRPDVLLIPDNIEHYIHVVHEKLPGGWKNNTRTILRRVARAVNPDDWPLKPLGIGSRVIKPPYDHSEEQTFIAVAPLPGRRDRLARIAVVCFSLGAGMSATETCLARPEDLREMPDGRLAVAVRGEQPRLVPIRRDYTELAREALDVAHESGVGRFLYGHSSIASDVAYRLLGDRRVDPNVETFSIRRARNTWLSAHLRAGTPVPVLRRFSGRLSQRALDVLAQRIADDLDPWQAANKGLAA